MDATSGAATATATRDDTVAGQIRDYFRGNPSRMTMMAARRFGVTEQAVLDALVGQWPVARLRDGTFRPLVDAMPALGTVRVFVRNKAAVIEAVGTFGGITQTGPFVNVQTDTLDMHILHEEVGAVYAVEKTGHDSDAATHSFQFFDRAGDAAFKVFLWEDFPNVPAHRIAAFRDLIARFARPADIPPGWEPEPERVAEPVAAAPATPPPAPPTNSAARAVPPPTAAPTPTPAPAPDGPKPVARFAPEPSRVPIPVPEGVLPGSAEVGRKILGEVSTEAVSEPPPPLPPRVKAVRFATAGALSVAVLTLGYWVTAAFVAPLFWRHFEHHAKLAEAPRFALTAADDPDEPLNVGLLGTEAQVIRALVDAGWDPADPGSFQAGMKAARAELRERPYPSATLPDLYLFGRRQDLLFQKAGEHGALRALHLWRSDDLGAGGRPLWLGAASLDRPAADGARRSTDPAAHHLAPDLDAQRDALFEDLTRALRLAEVFRVTGVGPTLLGRTADGDRYVTDGEMTVGSLTTTGPADHPPDRLPSPLLVRVKDQLLSDLRPWLVGNSGG